MSTEITTELANEITRLHADVENYVSQAKPLIEQAKEAAVQCGGHLDQAQHMSKGHMLAWLRDNVPNLTHERAKAYLSIFHTAQKRDESHIDHREMLQLGLIEMDERPVTERGQAGVVDGAKFVGWIGSIRGWWNKTTRERPVDQWTLDERQSVKDQLKPLIELYETL